MKKNTKKTNPEEVLTETDALLADDTSNTFWGQYKTVILVGLLLIGALAYYYKGTFVVASVNGTLIPRTAVLKELEKQGGKQTLQTLVTEKLIEQKATKEKILVSDGDVKKEIDKYESQFKAQGQKLDDVLAMQGMTRTDLVRQTKVQLSLQKLVKADDIKVTDKEIADYVAKNKDAFPKGTKQDEINKQVTEQLKNEKLSAAVQKFIEKIKAEAKIIYFRNY